MRFSKGQLLYCANLSQGVSLVMGGVTFYLGFKPGSPWGIVTTGGLFLVMNVCGFVLATLADKAGRDIDSS